MLPRLALLLSLFIMPLSAMAETVTVAAAANIKFAMEDIARVFEAQTGHKLRISYGSSGNFVAQIKHGAPFELFLSADEHYVSLLQQSGIIPSNGSLYAYGRLAYVAPKGSPLTLDDNFAGLKQLIRDGKLKRFALANPELAPYGERGRQLLIQAGLWDAVKDKLVLGDNASQAAQFAISGSAQGGIVALSLAKTPQFIAKADYLAIPEDRHEPLGQRMVLLPKASKAASELYQFIQGDKARAILLEYGFSLPAQGSTAETRD